MTPDLARVDVFVADGCQGNPAAVCVLAAWPAAAELQRIATRAAAPATAFVVEYGSGTRELRWFSPAREIQLCGHGTLAAACVVLARRPELTGVIFQTPAGAIEVGRSRDRLVMTLPSTPSTEREAPAGLVDWLGGVPVAVGYSDRYLVLLADEADVVALRPDKAGLAGLGEAVIVTAAGREYDFVSRYFAPAFGADEDAVTGSAHCTLVPFWADRLGKQELVAKQVSARGGVLWCRLQSDQRVELAGYARLRR